MMIHMKNYEGILDKIIDSIPSLGRLSGKSIMVTGATGMIGSVLVDCLMRANYKLGYGITIISIGRDRMRADERFGEYLKTPYLKFYSCDVNDTLGDFGGCDYIIHAASNTHPVAYSTDPIGTIASNIIGTKNLLDYAVHHHTRRFVFLSTVEVYGENRGDTDRFQEDYCGYIDCNTVRAGYSESKRAGESLCCAYAKQYGIETAIPRLCRIYGPTMNWNDSKAISQFIKNAVLSEDIILKSEGMQLYSYLFVADAVSAVFKIMLDGDNGGAYNVASEGSDIRMKELAEMLAGLAGTNVVFNLPDAIEKAGFSTATKALLDSSKLQALGWEPLYSMKQGLGMTIEILRDRYHNGGLDTR